MPLEKRMRFFATYSKSAEAIRITEIIEVCRDVKDNMLLELAVSGNAGYLVTGDKDLLVLDPFRGIRIVTPRQFLDIVV